MSRDLIEDLMLAFADELGRQYCRPELIDKLKKSIHEAVNYGRLYP